MKSRVRLAVLALATASLLRAPSARGNQLASPVRGLIGNVPVVNVRQRALLLVPAYVFSDGALEIDNIASMLEQQGIAYDRPSSPADFDVALETLSSYPLVIVPGYLEGDFLTPARQSALDVYVSEGGVLVVFKPVFDANSPAHQLTGTTFIERRFDVEAIAFDGDPTPATGSFDSPEERFVPLNSPLSGENIAVHLLTPASSNTQTLASAVIGGAAVGAVVTRRSVGAGAVYALGHDLHTFYHARCYVNCFEPSGDLAGLFLREAFRESTHGHVVLKHTVPGPEDSLVVLSHDLDALEAQQAGAAWGEAGALQVATLEQQHGARGSFLVTTNYVEGYYSPALMQQLCALGMCPVGAHSVIHDLAFPAYPGGACDETAQSYHPESGPTLCGEVRVPLELLLQAVGKPMVAWRSPYLLVHPSQYDVLESQAVLFDSSYGVGDLKFNLPLSLARTGKNQHRFHGRHLYTMPITIEDGLGAIVDGVITREEMSEANAAQFISLWTHAMLRNADNHAHTMALLHPSAGVGMPPDNIRHKVAVLDAFLGACRARGVKIDATMEDVVHFWRAREQVEIDSRYTPSGYEGTLRTGSFPIRDLTVEFGDVIADFACSTCGPFALAGRRVVLRGELAPFSLYEFRATPAVQAATPVPALGGVTLTALGLLLLFGGALSLRIRTRPHA